MFPAQPWSFFHLYSFLIISYCGPTHLAEMATLLSGVQLKCVEDIGRYWKILAEISWNEFVVIQVEFI